jgi:hypothetical protein
MPKVHKIAIHIAFALLIAWLLFASSIAPHTIGVDYERDAAANEEGEKLAIDRRIARYTLWLAAFTGILAISTIFLWWSTRKAAIAAQGAAEHIPRVERAYIYGGANFQGPPTGDGRVRIDSLLVKINNYGKTPAFIGTVAATICAESDLARPITWQVKQWKGWVLPAPTVDIGAGVSLPFTKLGDVIIGRIWYRDIFNDCHSSGFVLRLVDGLPAVGGQQHWQDRPEANLGPAQP